ncbi:MAG: endonuclease [Brumimicrobium sp.]|nr:endonuclease [Brumimicrobium sp.]
MYNKIISSLLFGFLFITATFSQIPMGYYDAAQGLDGSDLKAALHTIIKGHTKFPYTSSGTDVWDILKETDKDPNNPNNVILIYSRLSVNAAQEYNGGNGWNREHVWAKSRGDFGTAQGPGTDVHHIRPENESVNAARSNRWFGNASTPYNYNGALVANIDEDNWLWEPLDEVKGDVARMIFYMAVRYEGDNGEPDLEIIDYIPTNKSTKQPIHALLSDLLAWNDLDPVDDFERNRNDVIYYSYQHNRNPFIDHPEYAMQIWGNSLSGIMENTTVATTRELVKIVDILGRESEVSPNHLYIYVYSDGSTEKKVVVE